jgi:hypothetical protein
MTAMSHFLLTFGDASRPPVGVVIIEAPSMFQARMTAVVRRFATGVPFGEGHELSADMMTAIPPPLIGKMMSGAEAAKLILRLVEAAAGHDREPAPAAHGIATAMRNPLRGM